MVNSSEKIKILYQISLEIGEGSNIENAANNAVSIYLSKLNCDIGAIFQKKTNQKKCWYKQVNSIPKNLNENLLFKEATKGLPQSHEECAIPESIQINSKQKLNENSYSYILNLPGFGFLLIIKIGSELPEDLINSLEPLNKKLADSLLSFVLQEKFDLRSQALEASSNAIMLTDKHGYIQWVNKAWCVLNKFEKQEAVGQYSNILRSENHDEKVFSRMWSILLVGKNWSGTLVNKKKDGEEYIADLNITPVLRNNEIDGFIAISQDVTHKELAERNLKKNEALLSTLVNTIPDLVWMKDTVGNYLICNHRFNQYIGFDKESLYGKSDFDLINQENAEKYYREDTYVIENESKLTKEEEVEFAYDGHKELLEIIKSPVLDDIGNPIGVIGIARDISSRKRVEEELRESKSRFEEMAKLLPQPIWEIDKKGFFTYANNSGYDIFGYSEHELINGLHFDEIIAPFDRGRIRKVFLDKLRGRKTNETEYHCVNKDGSIFPVLIFSSPIYKGSDIIGVRGITLDISNLKEAQDQLKYLSDLQELLINISSQYINVSTHKIDEVINIALQQIGEFVSVDRSYIFDYNWEKNITINTYEWCEEGIEPQIDNLKDVPLDAIPQWVESHKKSKTVYVEDVLALAKDDSLREVLEPQGIKSLIAVPMFREDECVGFIGFDSVKEHHSYSDKEKSLLEVFAQILVNFQMRIKSENEIKEAKEKAENAEEAQFNFLSTMSHEIRTPLNAVVGLSNILLMENPKKEQLDNLQTLQQSSQNLLNIINDILDYNKLISGNIALEKTDFNLNNILSGIKNSMINLAKIKDINFEINIDDEIPEVLIGDSTRLLQILNNLVNNAIKFTQKGGVELNLRKLKSTKQKIKIQFEVKDSGIGIPKSKQKVIFEEFKQTSGNITREYGGTGLGLSIVKSLLEMMGSQIQLKSKVGEGSVFYFDLELSIGSEKKLINKNKDFKFDDSLSGLKVLLVEDNVINQNIALRFLNAWKCKTDIAENGKIAIEKVMNNKFDVVIMDLHMPVMDGYEATEEIRKLEGKRSETPIIALSASALGEIEIRTKKYGMNDFITKPFVPQNLFETLKKYKRD